MCSSTSADSRGIDLLAPVPMRELLDAWGGTLDPELLDRIVVRVSEPSRADSNSIAPVLSRRLTEVIGKLRSEGLCVILSESDATHSSDLVDQVFHIERGVVTAH